MIDNVKNWSFPLAGAISNPIANLTSLAKARGGFYPMGANGLWHGGVHFDQGTASAFEQSSVRCIADGEVIAYRIDDQYPLSRYTSEIPLIKQAPFSTGFVLVKHRLAPPPLSSAPSAATPPALTFYSLYMHLQDWAGYLAKPNLPRPSFWGEGLYKVKTDAQDPVVGLNVRGHHKVPSEHAEFGAYRTILCTLPRGTRVEVGEASPDGNWLKLASVTPLVAGLAAATGWVFKAEMKSLGGTSYLIADQAKDVPASPQQGLNVRAAANSGSDVLAVLPHGTQVRIGSEAAAGKYHRLVELVHGNPVPALTTQDDGKLPGFVWRDSLESTGEPKAKGSVVVLETPVPIKAGDLIGHLGLYQNHNQGAPQALLHLEVFSCEEVPSFIAQCRAHASRLPEAQNTLLKIHKGASKLIPHRTDINAANPPKITDDGVTVGVDLLIPQSLLDSLPADAKLLVPASTGGSACSPETRWWRLDNLLADADGNAISGWLAEQDMITTRHSPWEWPGYDFIEDREQPAGALAYHLEALRRLVDSERTSYQGMIDQSDKGPVKQRLYAILDGNGDRKITAEEIRTALGKPWHAQSIAQLITRHESEWLWNPGKWDELDELMEHRAADPNPDWVEEKKRIEKLSWWKELGGKHGINADGVVWHFQAIGLVALSKASDDENNISWLLVPSGQLTFDVEGNDIEDTTHPLHIYFSRVAHWPGGVSGVTIGRGYDLGQRPNPRKDLSAAKITEPLYSWLLGAKGLKGQAAKDYLASASPEIRKTKISRKQQYNLFTPVYEFMKSEVIRISNSTSNATSYGTLDWDATDKKIQDIAVDLIYRGDYTPTSRKEVQQSFIDNDLKTLRETMANQTKWTSVPKDRFNRRVDYLRQP